MQVAPIKLTLTAPGTKHLKLNCDVLLTSFCFQFNLRRCSKVPVGNLLGKENKGFAVIMHNFNHERWCGPGFSPRQYLQSVCIASLTIKHNILKRKHQKSDGGPCAWVHHRGRESVGAAGGGGVLQVGRGLHSFQFSST